MTDTASVVVLVHPDPNSLGEYVTVLAGSPHEFNINCWSSVNSALDQIEWSTVDCLIISDQFQAAEIQELEEQCQSADRSPVHFRFDELLEVNATAASPENDTARTDSIRFADRVAAAVRRRSLQRTPVMEHEDELSPKSREHPEIQDQSTTQRDQQFKQLADHLDEVVWMTTADKSEMLYVNPVYEDVWGRSRTDLYEDSMDFVQGIHPDDRPRVRNALESQPDGQYDETYRVRRPDGTIRWVRDQAIPIEGPDGQVRRVVGIAEDITQFKRREQMLTSLHEATRSLMIADTVREVADQTTHIAKSVLDLSESAFYAFEPDANQLQPLSWSVDFEELIGEHPPTFSHTQQSITWNVFQSGHAKLIQDVHESPSVYDDDTPFRSALVVPVGTHGVLLAVAPSVGVFDETDLKFGELLASTAEVILSRIDREQILSERSTALDERTSELNKVRQIGTITREIDSAISNARNRAQIEQRVCDRLVDTEYICAWIGRPGIETPGIEIHASAVTEGFRLNHTQMATHDETNTASPITEALNQNEVVTASVDNADRLDFLSTERDDIEPATAAVIPLVSGPTKHGILTVYASNSDEFDDDVCDVFGELGTTIAFAIDAVENRQLLYADSVPELTLRARDETSPLITHSKRHDCAFTFEQVIQLEDSVLAYLTIGGADPEVVLDDLATEPTVSNARVVQGTETEPRCELEMTTDSKVFQTVACGAQIRAATIIDGVATITVHVSPETEIREIVDDFEAVLPDLELVSKRNVKPARPLTEHGKLSAILSEKQEYILRAAFLAGYFDWPRETTIEELADRFDLSSATINYHLRKALENLLDSTFACNHPNNPEETT